MASNRESIWPGADDDLRALWDEGLKTREIGRRLGVSGSAVVGRAHRLDLPSRPSPIIRRTGAASPREPAKPRAPKITLPKVAAPAPPPVVWLRPRGNCQWPIGEPGNNGFRLCDEVSEPGKPYCDEHCKQAYVRVRDRREDAA